MKEINLTLIIPVFNATSFITQSLDRILAWKQTFLEVEVIIIDDGSTDTTLDILNEYVRVHPHEFSTISLPVNQGKGSAIRTGFSKAQGKYIVFTDADLPYGLDGINSIYQSARQNSEVGLFFGSRNHALSRSTKGYGLLRQFCHWFFSNIVRMILTPNVGDSQCGFKMLRSDLKKLVIEKSVINRFAFDIEIFAIAGENAIKCRDFPVELSHRKESSVRIVVDTLRMLSDILRIKYRVMRGLYKI